MSSYSVKQVLASTIYPGLDAFLLKAKRIFSAARKHFQPGLKMGLCTDG